MANALRDHKEPASQGEDHCSKMVHGDIRTLLEAETGRASWYFRVWEGLALNRYCGHVLTWVKLWRQTLVSSRMPQ